MNRQRLVQVIGLVSLGVIAACTSNSGSPAPSGSATTATDVLRNEYEAVGDVPLTGGITQIAFYDSSTYSLRRTNGPDAPELLSVETGKYVLDVAGHTLTLTPTAGASKSYAISINATSGSATVGTEAVHLNGLGDVLNEILSFLFNGQTFQSDDATPNSSDAGGGNNGGGGGSSGGGSGGSSGGGATGSGGASSGTGSSGGSGAGGSGSGSTGGGGTVGDASTQGPTCMPADAAPPPAPAPVGMGKGVDVSHYQGTINWTTVHSTQSFAYAKATEGTSYTDAKFATYFPGMKTAGIARGAYHFFRASKDPVAQADYFVKALQSHGYDASTDLAPMLDVEVTDGVSAATVVSGVRKFLAEAQAKLGTTLIIYTGPSFWTSTLGNPDLSTNPLWIAQYTSASEPKVPSHWPAYTIWQYSESLPVAGIGSAGVDNDKWPSSSATTAAPDASTTHGTLPVCVPDAGHDAGKDSSSDAGPGDSAVGDADGFDAEAVDGAVGDGGLIPGTCTHDVCTAGDPLGQACNPCTKALCAAVPYCCDTLWGASCVDFEVPMYCGQTCN
jgi:lysozyme